MKNLAAISDSLAAADIAETIKHTKQTLDDLSEVMEKINKGEGTMGQLINNDSLYNNLEAVSLDLDKLLIDMRTNPGRYVHFSIFGRRDKNKPVN